MDCNHVQEDEIVERYVSNRLSDEERTEFEEHYFFCPQCADRVRALQAVRAALLARGARKPARSWMWPALAAAAAVILVTLLGVMVSRPRQQRVAASPERAAPPVPTELARIEPPAYAPAVMRGSAGTAERRFRAAMRHYQAGDFAATIPELQSIIASQPSYMDARFYLGACYLLTGQTGQAIGQLQSVAAAGDASPFDEEARFL